MKLYKTEEIDMALIDRIDGDDLPNPQTMDEEEFGMLQTGLADHGFLAPLLVKPTPDGRFLLVHGEHRFLAAKQLGAEMITATIGDPDWSVETCRILAMQLNSIHGEPLRIPIETKRFSLDRGTAGYDTLKEVLYEPGRFSGFFCELVVKELLGLVTIRAAKIDHLEDGSKDTSDAVAGSVHGALLFLNEHLPLPAYRGQGMGDVIVSGSRDVVVPRDTRSNAVPFSRPRAFG